MAEGKTAAVQPPPDPEFPAGVSGGTPPAEPTETPKATPDPATPAEPPKPESLQDDVNKLFPATPVEAVPPATAPTAAVADEVARLQKRLEDRQGTIDRQGKDLGELRARERELSQRLEALEQSAISTTPEEDFDPQKAYSDPEYIPRYVQSKIEAGVTAASEQNRKEFEQTLDPFLQIQAAQAAAAGNPLMEKALTDPTTLSRIQQLSREGAREAYSLDTKQNALTVQLKAAAFDAIGEKFQAQPADRARAREDLRSSRTDMAGARSPEPGAASTPEDLGVPEDEAARVSKMSPAEGAKYFTERFQRERYGGKPSG